MNTAKTTIVPCAQTPTFPQIGTTFRIISEAIEATCGCAPRHNASDDADDAANYDLRPEGTGDSYGVAFLGSDMPTHGNYRLIEVLEGSPAEPRSFLMERYDHTGAEGYRRHTFWGDAGSYEYLGEYEAKSVFTMDGDTYTLWQDVPAAA